jgi:hypothetical protein
MHFHFFYAVVYTVPDREDAGRLMFEAPSAEAALERARTWVPPEFAQDITVRAHVEVGGLGPSVVHHLPQGWVSDPYDPLENS